MGWESCYIWTMVLGLYHQIFTKRVENLDHWGKKCKKSFKPQVINI